MNNDELMTTVRESVTGVHMTIPEEQIVSRSAAIRAPSVRPRPERWPWLAVQPWP